MFTDLRKIRPACDEMVCCQESVKVLKTRILEALKVATRQQQECEQLRFQLAESQRAHEVIFYPLHVCTFGFWPVQVSYLPRSLDGVTESSKRAGSTDRAS